jgi:DNA anti-recombination protein RmuC
MIMQVATLDILTEKGHFTPEVARAIGEAIELESERSRAPLATNQRLSEVQQALSADTRQLRYELQSEIAELRQEFKNDIAELRQELKADIAELRHEIKSDIAALRQEFKSDMAALRTELKGDIAALQVKLEASKSEVVRWVFGVMIGQSALLLSGTYFFLQHAR